ncbi:hypothetical protein [Nonomuraea aurantiaca]|nr:hypothetical protein [Nonomuraea aurantiaca]MCA2219816.1 hypothetical protein [Nonomuraea aurantiaca]
MATLMDRVRAYLRSPQGKQTMEKAKRMANDPENQRKARRFLDKLRSRRH